MVVGGYELHLYCDYPDDTYAHRGSGQFPGPGFGEFSGDKGSECRRDARQSGWKIEKGEMRALCPMCRQLGRVLPKIV
jgi:hypothetical protein